jgi:hypothetical protein
MTVVLHPFYLPDFPLCDFPLFPRLKIRLKGRHSDSIEVIEAESQAVLNTLTEHDFQDAFKKVTEEFGTVCTHRTELL